jgi:hypothetical protein
MAGREIVVVVLDQMEELDEEIGPARPGTKQLPHLAKRVPVQLPPLWKRPGALP